MTRFLQVQEVIAIHDQLITSFGGCHGLRDLGLLVSAVEIPKSKMGGQFLHPSLFDQASAYLFHICNNHPFIDGNKRTSAVAALVFLEDNNILLEFDEYEFEELVVQVAMGQAGKEALRIFFQQSHLV
ncbi:MAG: type II toxin-antitoxin system death-on-curing family toxin [Chlamydiales bacterium]|nr:type II toxin-antitoxin system death-on-curing family toxin [Chlamydiales bacterium]